MKPATSLRLAVALAAVGVMTAGCFSDRSSADTPTAPNPPKTITAALLPGVTLPKLPLQVPLIFWKKPLLGNVVVTQTITPAGGTIQLQSVNTSVTFAPGAVSQNTAVSVTVYGGSAVAYGFAPHGLQFNAPVTLTQGLQNTVAYDTPAFRNTMLGGYIPNGLADIDSTGVANITEQHPATTTAASISGQTKLTTASFPIPHFSGYILSSGAKPH